jgi:hypothetical protein
MTRLLIASLAGLVAGLSAAPEAQTTRAAERVAVVVDASGPGAEQRLAAARSDAAERDATLRVPRTLHDQLAVTSMLAAGGYDTIVGYGLEEYASIAPLAGEVRYVAAD